MYWVYVLQNPSGTFYIGQTEDIEARLLSHNDATAPADGKFARKNGPWELVWKESHVDRSAAMHREREIKSWKSSRMIRTRLLGQAE